MLLTWVVEAAAGTTANVRLCVFENPFAITRARSATAPGLAAPTRLANTVNSLMLNCNTSITEYKPSASSNCPKPGVSHCLTNDTKRGDTTIARYNDSNVCTSVPCSVVRSVTEGRPESERFES